MQHNARKWNLYKYTWFFLEVVRFNENCNAVKILAKFHENSFTFPEVSSTLLEV